MNLIIVFFSTFILTILFTLAIKRSALFFNVVDKPDSERKIHKKNIPLMGGVAIFLSFFVVLLFLKSELLSGNLTVSHWIGFFIGACFLIIGGIMDDIFKLKPGQQIIFPILAIFAVIMGGIEIEKITNPLGGFLFLDSIKIPILEIGSYKYFFVVISDIFIFLWLMGMMYTTKLLDGVDGLVSGVVGIGAFITFLFTMTTRYFQPDIGIAALALSAACAGFLVFNWHPAKIFLGEGGSLFLGYALGVLAVISGGKIAIAFLIMGIPIMDVAWTIIRRLRDGKNPFKFADRKHLHFRLLDLGMGQRRVAFIFYALSFVFGMSALFLQSAGKIFAIGLLVIIMILIVLGFNKKFNKT